MIDSTQNPHANPWRHGFADACLGRVCSCPFMEWHEKEQFIAGYLAGQCAMRDLEKKERTIAEMRRLGATEREIKIFSLQIDKRLGHHAA